MAEEMDELKQAATLKMQAEDACLSERSSDRPTPEPVDFWKDRYLRLHADVENTKKRLARSSAQEVEAQKKALLRDMLPVADGLDLALMHTPDQKDNRGILQGIEMVRNILNKFFAGHGVKAIDAWGQPLKAAYRQNLSHVDATVHTISSNLYASMDNDDMFQYLGGLSMAVRKAAGKDPEVFVSVQKTLGQGHIEPLALTIGRELRSRYLNPQWIKGMQKENYAGARAMADAGVAPEEVDLFILATAIDRVTESSLGYYIFPLVSVAAGTPTADVVGAKVLLRDDRRRLLCHEEVGPLPRSGVRLRARPEPD